MDIRAEKFEIIQWVTQLTDENIIEQLKALRGDRADWWDGLSTAEKEDIDQGLKDLDAGRKKDFAEVMEKYRKAR